MITTSEQTKHTMDNYLSSVASDRRSFSTQARVDSVNNKMRMVQIDLIRSHWDDMDDVTKARAKRTLDEIGGDEFRGLAL